MGNIQITYRNFPPGPATVTNTIAGAGRQTTVTSTFNVSPANPSPVIVLAGLTPGTYGILYTWTDSAGQQYSNYNTGPSSAATAPDCLANGTAAPITAPIVGMAVDPNQPGYAILGTDGDVYSEGGMAPSGTSLYGSPTLPIVGMAMATSSLGRGAWLVGSNGSIFTSGWASFHGSLGGVTLNKPIVGMALTPDDQGYWMVASDGGVFAFGDARFQGSMGGTPLNQPIVGMAADDATGGYWLVAADGGIFSFNAPFFGSTGAIHLNKPIVGMEAAPDGSGYRFVASDGGVFCFNLPFEGSMGSTPLNQPVVGMAAEGPLGYWLVAADGGIFSFGGAPFYGSPA